MNKLIKLKNCCLCSKCDVTGLKFIPRDTVRGESRQPWAGVCLGPIDFFQKV